MSRYIVADRKASIGAYGLGTIGAGFRSLLIWMLERQEAVRQRRRLLELDDYLLKDIGISRADAEFEASRSNWIR